MSVVGMYVGQNRKLRELAIEKLGRERCPGCKAKVVG